MSRLPSLTPREVVAALKRTGFIETHQKGSHKFLHCDARNVTAVVPMHTKELARGTL